jgi:hypothetical protein
LRAHGKRAYVTVNRDNLVQQPLGWLGAWATQLEQQGCVAPGGGMSLAIRVADSVPIDARTALYLLYSNEMQSGEMPLGLDSRIQLISPLWRIPGLGLMAEGPYDVSGHGYSLTVTGRSTENLVGIETIMYAVKPRSIGRGFTIAPLYAEKSINGATERRPKPTADLLAFPPNAAFYSVFYKSWKNEFTAMMVGAPTPVELNRRIKMLKASGRSASCESLDGKICIALPNDVGLAVLVAINVNGSEVFVSRGATVFNAILSSGELHPEIVLPTLEVFRPWNNRPVAVTFDHDYEGILKLVLKGGEVISWRRH